MNKKILSSCLALALLAIASAPVYNQLALKNNVHPSTELSDPGQVSATQQTESSAGYTVTYPPNSSEIASAEVTDQNTPASPSPDVKAASGTDKSKTPSDTEKKTAAKPAAASKTALSSRSKTTARVSVKQKTAAKPSSASTTSTVKSSSSKVAKIISTAKNLMGIPYVWGGTTTSGFDCSGFTQYVFARNGITLPRTAAEQFTVGTVISRSNLKVGDLIFFTTYKAGASHLGIYLGNNNFIHASSTKGVTISSLTSDYYSSRYIGARRMAS